MFPTVGPPPQRLLLFARLPELGRVKTRLASEVGDERALAIYQAMLRDTLGRIGESSETTEIECFWAPSPDANGAALRAAFAHHAVAMQTGETLGDRLAMAFSERFFFHRTMKIIAIGTDEPTIDREFIERSFALLDSCEYVVGPAEDGGYYLIGCRAASFTSEIFRDIDWGTSLVLAQILRKIAASGRTVALLPLRYDIDTLADVQRYATEAHEGELARLLRG